jgi:uncharacterized membrane protein YhaH (DUF805 family)
MIEQRSLFLCGDLQMLRSLFSFSGRMSRAQFRRALVPVLLMMIIPGTVLRVFPFVALLALIPVVFFIIAAISMYAIWTQRVNDLGGSVPVHTVWFGPFGLNSYRYRILYLIFREGQPHDNAYGPPPVA